MSVGLGSETDAAFNLSDEFDESRIFGTTIKKYHIPQGTSKVRKYF